jgi:hypothetical protein
MVEYHSDQLAMAAQHGLGGRRVQQQGDQVGRVGVYPKDIAGLDLQTTALAERLNGLQAAHGGAAQDPGDGIVAQLGEQAMGLPAAGTGQWSRAVGA